MSDFILLTAIVSKLLREYPMFFWPFLTVSNCFFRISISGAGFIVSGCFQPFPPVNANVKGKHTFFHPAPRSELAKPLPKLTSKVNLQFTPPLYLRVYRTDRPQS